MLSPTNPPSSGNGSSPLKQRELVRLLTEHTRRIYAFLYTLVGNSADAEDLLQETSVTIWDKADQFELGSNFVAWALQIASNKARNWMSKRQRSSVLFDQDVFEMVASETVQLAAEFDSRHEALKRCLDKLEPNDHQVLTLRYQQALSVEIIALRCGQSDYAVYRALRRIKRALFDCITRTVSSEA